MSYSDLLQIGFYLLVLFLLTPVFGAYMAKVFAGEKHPLSVLGFLERSIYRVSLIDTNEAMNWKRYALSILWFSLFGFLATLLLQVEQHLLPLNPENLGGVPLPLAINTAMSFVTNTNWQAYGGENTLSYLTQALGLGVQNFLSAATGIAVLLALIRG
ncbi:MAG TPA: potassium-transporting ATPase subunit KdpA, partial [Myxococcota bacterium]|nr:potassium-transporting ATPase subunit KdpA [Myxococcota bacterium]